MDWGDALRGVVVLCSLAIVGLTFTALRRERTESGGEGWSSLPPESRRLAVRVWLIMGAAAALVAGSYFLASYLWSAKVGAGVAIAVAMLAVAIGFAVIGFGVSREARQDRSRRTPPH
jgi:hypothetical protein